MTHRRRVVQALLNDAAVILPLDTFKTAVPFLFSGLLVLSACELTPLSQEEDGELYAPGWSCSGTTGKTESPSSVYYATSFGCWRDEDGDPRGDSSDNCVPYCMSGSSKNGTKDEYDALCGGLSGPECERQVAWYVADSDRFGCMSRLKVTNTENGKAAVVVVLDRGPSCRVERRVRHWVLDMSYPATNYLFGGQRGPRDRAAVRVEPVPSDTPLGPLDGDSAYIGDSCTIDFDCDFIIDGAPATCDSWFDADTSETQGVCTADCEDYCPGYSTFCAQVSPERGACHLQASAQNAWCNDITGTVLKPLRRYIGGGTSSVVDSVCVPPLTDGIACTAGGESGECIDTDHQECSGTVHVGACPGPSGIRCCTP